MPDWPTIASLATAGGTLVLAVATFSSVRSANRAARVAEQSLLASMRPLLLPSRLQDPPQRVGFADQHWVSPAGGCGTAEVTPEAVYLTMSLRNTGTGAAILHGWRFEPSRDPAALASRPGLDGFRRLSRDLYLPAGDLGFWQGVLREPDDPDRRPLSELIAARERIVLDLLYGDLHGGQRVIGRFSLLPGRDGAWLASAARHWNVDQPDPR